MIFKHVVLFFISVLFSFLFAQESSEKLEKKSLEKYVVEGDVSDARGKKLGGVEIIVRKGVSVLYKTKSTDNGKFSFTFSETGLYSIFFNIAQKKSKTTILTIVQGQKSDFLAMQLEGVTKLDVVDVAERRDIRANQKKVLQVTTFDSKSIEEKGIGSVNDLSGASANVYVLDTGSSSSLYLALRGITSVGTLDPVVVFYIDGVAQFQSINNPLQLANIKSIEIYKGAQGSTFGRNALAGVIEIYTKRPKKKLGGDVSVELSSKLQHSYVANFSLPVYKEMIFGKAGAFFSMYDGDFYNSTLDKRLGGHLNYNVYGEFDFLPIPSLEFSLLGKYESINEEAFPYVGGAKTFEGNLALAMKHPYNVNYNVENKNVKRTGSGIVKIHYFNDAMDLLSVMAYQNFYNNLVIDTDFSESDIGSANLDTKINLITEELKISSGETTSKYFEWLVGAFIYYQSNKSKTDIAVNNSIITTFDFVMKQLDVNQNNFGVAFFGNLDIPLSSWIMMVLGSRFDVDLKDVDAKKNFKKESGKIVKDFDFKKKKNDWFYSPKLAFQFQLAPEFSLFLSATRGFRSGGINTFVSNEKNLFYDKETSWQSELGIKVNDKGRRSNFSFFYTYWQNQQVNVFFEGDFFQFGLFNAKKSYALGSEMELFLPIFYGFSVEGMAGISLSKFLEYTSPEGVLIKDTSQPFVPESMYNVALRHEYTLNFNKINFVHINRIAYKYVKDIFYDPVNRIRSKGYGLLNFTTTFRIHNVMLSFWFKNILNKRYVGFSLPFGGIVPVRLGNPFTFGSKISVFF